jgi:hypothetical protein
VFAVAIKSCVAINHCWKVFEVVNWVIAIICYLAVEQFHATGL